MEGGGWEGPDSEILQLCYLTGPPCNYVGARSVDPTAVPSLGRGAVEPAQADADRHPTRPEAGTEIDLIFCPVFSVTERYSAAPPKPAHQV